MIEEELIALYKKTKKQLANLLEDLTFANFYRALQSGRRAFTLKNTQIVKTVDEEWIDAIMEAIPHIDEIVNNPRRYMKRETDVMPVEKARRVDSESVRHLASHTNLIQSVEDGEVRPNKILSAYNEESLELYENRFVMTVVTRLAQFVDRRYFLLGSGGTEFSSTAKVEGTFEQAGENTEYTVDMTVHQGADYFEGGIQEKVYEDLFTIKKYVNSFKYSPFMRAMSVCAPVRPPIVKTNLLTKDPHYRACHKLWDFMDSYNKAGYKIEVTDFTPELDNGLVDDFDAVNLLQYIAVKNKMADYDSRRRGMEKCSKRVIKPEITDFEPTADVEADAFASFRSGTSLKGGSDKDRERALKEVILRALRKEQVKRELEERMRKQTEEELESVIKSALLTDKERREEERRERERRLRDSIKAALAAENERARAEAAERAKLERRTADILKRQVTRYERSERQRLEAEQREQAERDELMSAILSDMLRVEEERQYIRESPVVVYGHERVPVPVPEQRLPATTELIGKYADMFTPPPRLEEEDWETLKKEAEQGRPRRRVGERRVYDAIERALAEERKRRRRERAAERAKANAAEDALPEAAATEDALTDEEILRVLETAQHSLGEQGEADDFDGMSQCGVGEDAELSLSGAGGDTGRPAEDEGEPARQGGRGQSRFSDDEEEAGCSRLPSDDEVHKSFWRRLFEILFLWWKKK